MSEQPVEIPAGAALGPDDLPAPGQGPTPIAGDVAAAGQADALEQEIRAELEAGDGPRAASTLIEKRAEAARELELAEANLKRAETRLENARRDDVALKVELDVAIEERARKIGANR